MRIFTDARDSGSSRPRYPRMGIHEGEGGLSKLTTQIGSAAFDYLANKKGPADMSENIHPNLVQITEFQRGAHLSSFSSTSLDKSGESDRVTMRRRIRGPNKQKKGERCRSHRDCDCGEETPASSM